MISRLTTNKMSGPRKLLCAFIDGYVPMKQKHASCLWTVLLLIVLSGITSIVIAGSLPHTNRYGDTLVTYAQVNRSDGTYRRMLTSPETVKQLKSDQPFPDGTRILMETYYSTDELSTVFHMQKLDGRWHYGSFDGQGVVNLTVRPQASCLSCHTNAAATDFVFTQAAIKAASMHGLRRLNCNRPGRSPCSVETYNPGNRK